MSLLTLTREGPLFLLKLHHADNRFSPDFITASTKRLIKSRLPLRKRGWRWRRFAYQNLMERFLTFRIPTVAALSGHAFAGGCMFALTHDYRVMRSDRGFMCMNEVDMPANLTPGMMSILRWKVIHPIALRDMVIQGRRFNAVEAATYGFVDVTADGPDAVIDAAKKIALKVATKAKAGLTYKTLKTELYSETSGLLKSKNLGFVEHIFSKL
ncbi:ClpP/crotonase-like domain-containing protein [Chytridium lagenaria]|nr:ClpP/crotonase-like domain-containing protein [Chytridium lagenaria]